MAGKGPHVAQGYRNEQWENSPLWESNKERKIGNQRHNKKVESTLKMAFSSKQNLSTLM